MDLDLSIFNINLHSQWVFLLEINVLLVQTTSICFHLESAIAMTWLLATVYKRRKNKNIYYRAIIGKIARLFKSSNTEGDLNMVWAKQLLVTLQNLV
jgi:hypothetical protein